MRRLSEGEVSGLGMEELALALAQLREDFRQVTAVRFSASMPCVSIGKRSEHSL